MKTYKVIGRSTTLGHKPGETFEADISDKHEARLIQRGSLEVVTSQKPAPEIPGGKTPPVPPAGKE